MQKPKWKPDDEQLKLLETLREEVAQAASQTEFARQHLPFGASTLSKILAVFNPEAESSYFDEVDNPEPKLAEIRDALEQLELDRNQNARANQEPIHRLRKFEAVAAAIQECRNKKSCERLIKYLAPTGGGKTMLCNYLAQRHGVRVTEGREMWRHRERGYSVFLTDVCRVARVRLRGETRIEKIEESLIQASRDKSILLALDEGEFFGATVLNGLRYLLNKTSIVVLICAIRQAHDRWNRYYPVEADQLARRTHAVIEMDSVTPADARQFFAPDAFKRPEEALEMIAAAASSFGMFSALQRIARHLQIKQAGKSDVEKAIAKAAAEMNRTLTFTREEAR